MSAFVVVDCVDKFYDLGDLSSSGIEKIVQLCQYAKVRHIPIVWVRSIKNCDAESHTREEGMERVCHVEEKGDIDNAIIGDVVSLIDRENHIVLDTQQHCSAFESSRLEKYLRKEKISELCFAGVASNAQVVLVKTMLQSLHLGFKSCLVSDVCQSEQSPEEIMTQIVAAGGQIKTLQALFRDMDTFGEGDSQVIYDVVTPDERKAMGITCHNILNEVKWCIMRNRGIQVPRLIAIQGEVDPVTGAQPLYRHPADEQPALVPFTPAVNSLRLYLSEKLNQPFNHVLIQYYRDGKDNIGEHSDKTLDIARNTAIVNFSLGVTRTMHLKRKRQQSPSPEASTEFDRPLTDATGVDTTAAASVEANDTNDVEGGSKNERKYEYQKVIMRNNSLFVLGWETNRKWLHAIRTDKRPDNQKYEDEIHFLNEEKDAGIVTISEDDDGEKVESSPFFTGRISFTFRTVATFLSADGTTITGQGAPSTPMNAHATEEEKEQDAMRMLKAFSRENHNSDFEWEELYGEGFSTLNFRIINVTG